MTNREAGINEVREMRGNQAAAKLRSSAAAKSFRAPIPSYAVGQVFADIWSRPGLDRRSRSLVSMSVMIAMRQPHEFAIHMGAARHNDPSSGSPSLGHDALRAIYIVGSLHEISGK